MNGVAWKSKEGTFVVYRTPQLRKLKMRALRRFRPEVNYLLTWNDVQGFGLHWAHSEWVPSGQVYYA